MPHHLLDVWDVTERGQRRRVPAAGPGRGRRRARPRPGAAAGRRFRPLRPRGVDELDFPGTDPELRARLEAELAARGPARSTRDCPRWTRPRPRAILPSNGRRLVRALEVVELTGRPFTATLPEPVERYDTVQIGLDRRRPGRAGRSPGGPDVGGRPGRRGARAGAARAAGRADREPGARLPAGARARRTDAPRPAAETVRATRRFVRRQRSWFRRDPRVRWLDGGRAGPARAAARVPSCR